MHKILIVLTFLLVFCMGCTIQKTGNAFALGGDSFYPESSSSNDVITPSTETTLNPSSSKPPKPGGHTCDKTCDELLFKDITNKFESLKYSKVTENALRPWGTKDPDDPSGDIEDLTKWMIELHKTCYRGDLNLKSSREARYEILELMAYLTGYHAPMEFSFVVMYGTPEDFSIKDGHRMIALETKALSKEKYEIRALDPNGPSIATIICEPQDEKSIPTCRFTKSPGLKNPDSFYHKTGVVHIGTELRNTVRTLIDTYKGISLNHCKKPYIDYSEEYCKRYDNKWNKWLENNYLEISNQKVTGYLGMCSGWTRAHMMFTYLADFSGECPKAGDGSKSAETSSIQGTNTYPCGPDTSAAPTIPDTMIPSSESFPDIDWDQFFFEEPVVSTTIPQTVLDTHLPSSTHLDSSVSSSTHISSTS